MRYLSLALVLCAALGAGAQEPTKEERAAQAKNRLQVIQERLKLSPEQVEKLKPIVQQEVQELKAVRDKQGSDSSRRAKLGMAREMKGVQDKYDGQIKAILTKEQQKEWDRVKEERREQLKQQRRK